jgi:cell division septation protein DedD
MKRITGGLAALAIAVSAGVHAQSAKVEAVQYPAWLERGGLVAPLTPGTDLQSKDRLRTGGNARVLLRLSEGSTVKLGENARFEIEQVENKGVFRAALQVLAGAFRFTTAAIAKRQHRDVTIRVQNVTAGIRGTDVWGKASGERDLVCLLEGRVQVKSEGSPEVTLDKPRDFYAKPRGGEPQVATVDQKQIDTWSRETEIEPGDGAARVGGKWRVAAGRFEKRDSALALARDLRARGFPARVHEESPTVFAADIPGLASEDEARALMANLRGIPGVTIPSIHSNDEKTR